MRDGVWSDVLKGAVAGLAATWMMDRATTFLYEREADEAREREREAREGRTAYGVAAEKVARLAGRDLPDENRPTYGNALHWALGSAAGATYGAMRHRLPGDGLGRGLLFGTAFWATVDEGANPALGLTPGPGAFPWQTHARGAAGHLVFGATADAALRVLDRVA